MSAFDLPPALAAQLRATAHDATISAARAFGFGGDTWSVQRPAGDGISGPATPAATTAVTALAFQQRPGGLAAAAAGTQVLDTVWRLIVLAGTVQAGDQIASVADGTYQFTIVSVEQWYGYQRCDLERR